MSQTGPKREGLRARAESRAKSQDRTARRPDRENEIHLIARSKNSPDIQVPWNVRLTAAWSWRILVIFAVVVIASYLIMQLQVVVIPALIALVLTVALDPLVRFLRKRFRFPKALAVVTTMLVFLGGTAAMVALAGSSIGSGFGHLQSQALSGIDELLSWLADGPLKIDAAQIDRGIAEIQRVIQENVGTLASGVFSATSSVVNSLTATFLVLFMALFFLLDGRRIWTWIVRLLPPSWRLSTHEASLRGYTTLSGYVRATVLVAFIDAVGIAGGAFFLGVQLWLPIGVLVFLFSFIPLVGALISGGVATLVALVDLGMTSAIIMLVIVLAVQQIESNLLQPFIMSSSVALHPVAVLLGVSAGTYVAGIAGAVFAVPIMAFLNTFILYLSGHDKYPRLATDPDRPGGPPGALSQQIQVSYGYGADDESAPDFLKSSEYELRIARDIANVYTPAEAAHIEELEQQTGEIPAVDDSGDSETTEK